MTLPLHRAAVTRSLVLRTVQCLLSLGGVVLLAACSTMGPTITKESSIPEAATRLSVETLNGSIVVRSDPTVVGVVATAKVRCHGATREEAEQRARDAALVMDRDSSGAVTVRVTIPEPHATEDAASIEVRLARTDGITLKTSNGRVVVEGFDGELSVQTSNGAVEVQRFVGSMSISTTNGRIEVAESRGPVQAETSNGRISLGLLEGTTGDIAARTSNGAISVNLPASWQGTITAGTSNGRVELSGPAGEAQSRDSADEATLVVGQGSAAKAEMRTSNGSIRVRVAK